MTGKRYAYTVQARLVGGLIAIAQSLFFSAFANPDCRLEFAGAPPAFAVEYDAFSPVATVETAEIHVRNSGSETCGGFLAMFSQEPGSKQSAYPRYEFHAAASHDIINYASGVPPQTGTYKTVPLPAIGGGKTVTVPIRFFAGAGQVLPPGHAATGIYAALYDGNGLAAEGAVTPLALDIEVLPVMSLSLAGAGESETVDFGALQTGAARTVLIRAKSNRSFSFELQSDNGGAMRLKGRAGGVLRDRVAYDVSVNGGPAFSLEGPVLTQVSYDATGLGGEMIPIRVTLGDTSNLRAGLYGDVITVTITGGF